MDTTAARGRGARLLATLAVLLGLLAMHGVAGAHHAAAAPVTGHAAMPSDGTMAAGAAHGHPVVQHATAGPDAALAAPTAPSCGDGCQGVAALCVAVLVGAAFALLLSSRRAPLLLCAPARPRARGPAPPVRHARRPDPVRELCVSRT